MKVTNYWTFSQYQYFKTKQKELSRGRPGGPSEDVIALPRVLTRLPREMRSTKQVPQYEGTAEFTLQATV